MNRLPHRLFCSGLVIALILQLAPSGIARAQQTAALSDDQVKERLGYIENALRSAQPRAEMWSYGWLVLSSVGSAAGGTLDASQWIEKKIGRGEAVPDREFADGMLVGGATLALGVGALLLDPFVPAYAPNKLRPLKETTPEERLAKLEKAEELLRRCARREKSGRSWTTHLWNIGFSAAGALATKAVFRQSWGTALVSFAGTEAFSLLIVFTQPMQATRDLKEYEQKYLGKNGGAMPARPESHWMLSVWPGGLTFRLEF
jgi:hypothetical protein